MAAKTPGWASASATALLAGGPPHADRDDPLHAGRGGLGDQLVRRDVARVQVGVGVDYAASSSTRGNSWPAGATVTPGSPPPQAAAARSRRAGSCPRATRMRSADDGDHGPEQDRHGAQALGEAVERLVELAGARGVLGQRPRRALLHQAVEPLHDAPDVLDGARDVEALEVGGERARRVGHLGGQLAVVAAVGGHHAVPVPADHADHPVEQVAELVGQFLGVAGLEALGGERAVLAEAHLARQVVAQRVDAVPLDEREGVDHVAGGLAHLLAALEDVAVDHQPPGQLEAGRHQHGRPDDRVELEDVLGHQLQVGRPELLDEVLAGAGVAEGGAVVEQRVDPDVDRLLGVPRHRHAPLHLGARHRQLVEAQLDHAARLVEPRLRLDPARVGVEVRQQTLAVGGQAEEPVLLLHPLHRGVMDRAQAALEQVVLGVERLAGRAVPAAVAALVDVPRVVQLLEDALHLGLVLGVGGADEEVVGRVEHAAEGAEARREHVGLLARGPALALGRSGDLAAVLVGTGQEEDVLAQLPVMAGDDVGHDRRVRVTDVRVRVDVIDRRREVEASVGHDPGV